MVRIITMGRSTHMPGAGEGRVGVVGEISGFVVHEDQSFSARMQRDLALNRDVFLRLVREKTAIAPAYAPDWMSRLSQRLPVPDRAKDMLALVALLLHLWTNRRDTNGEIVISPSGRASRIRLTVMLAVISFMALGAALFLGEDREPDLAAPPLAIMSEATSEPQPSEATTLLAAMQPIAPAQAAPSAPVIDLPVVDETPWVAVKRPMPMYHLEAPEIEQGDLAYRVFTRGKAARQDVLNVSPQPALDGKVQRPSIHLLIERYEAQKPTVKPLYSDLAMRASEQMRSLGRMSAPFEVSTKFGTLEAADLVMDMESGAQTCIGFRRVDMIGLTLMGWYCGTRAKPVDRVMLECFINRLDLIGAGQDLPLKRLFAEAERNRRSCASAKQAGRKITWMDHEAPMPPLKMRNLASAK